MGSPDSSPNGPELGSLLCFGSLVDIHASFAEVVLGGLGVVDPLEFQNGLVWLLVVSISSEAHEFGSDPNSDWCPLEMGRF